ncbi:MAG TPA: DegT/DnrJ/EryC1/StrS family aminotransferase [Flavobacteriales bacterium]|nr:DegT/DnrJ/EryC1/StrS family aminotransferase [Flavobacteriales bacterium]HPH81081.1 DegT/DnrJ/EryC1/StrS family aminotransferase [Flavobacteriales bacterium]
MIPFSPPHIDQEIIDEVTAALRSGWITTGPRTKQFEKDLSEYNGNPNTLCLNSATAGLEIVLRWFGVGPGDEVIVPAYTYSATANVVMHTGARPVFCDVKAEDFNIDPKKLESLITERTKVIMPVDFGGMPCDFDAINSFVKRADIQAQFKARGEVQEKLGRILILSDAAHSIGARYQGKMTGSLTDVSVFSFHAVKNLTTAEGGAVALNLPEPFDNKAIYDYLCIATLHGQNKDALAKMQKGNWKYDIIEPGYKCNMTDIMAAIGLVELRRYESKTLPRRKQIFDRYKEVLSQYSWAELAPYETDEKISSYHLFPLRIRGIAEAKRDAIMQKIFDKDVSVNVHFIPVPMMKFYKEMGYSIDQFPVTYDNFSREISLPVFIDLSDEQVEEVLAAVIEAVETSI